MYREYLSKKNKKIKNRFLRLQSNGNGLSLTGKGLRYVPKVKKDGCGVPLVWLHRCFN